MFLSNKKLSEGLSQKAPKNEGTPVSAPVNQPQGHRDIPPVLQHSFNGSGVSYRGSQSEGHQR